MLSSLLLSSFEQELATLTGHGTTKTVCCDFSLDGKMLASGGHDKKVTSSFPLSYYRR